MNKNIIFVILLIIATIAMTILIRSYNGDLLLQGEVDAPQVVVSSKAGGRISEIHVKRGDDVRSGDVLLTLDSPELTARVNAATAARDRAKAQLALSENGTREESIRYYKALVEQANIVYQNANREFERNQNIAAKGYISQSAWDALLKTKESTYQQWLVAKANLDQAVHGDRREQRMIYAAQLEQSEQELNGLLAQYSDLIVKAPVSGEIGTLPAEEGEYFNAYSPLITVVRLPKSYFVFNLRESILGKVHKSDEVMLIIPALGNKSIKANVGYIAPMGDFATLKATRATGDFDLKTFEVRLYPTTKIEGLRPGMSVLWVWKK